MSLAEPATASGRGRPRPRRSPGASVVGVVGELLITAGVIVALFVVWQVFWTDIEGGQEAASNIQTFEESLPISPEQAGEPQDGAPPEEPAPAAGEAFATMFVPRWGSGWQFPIAEGVGRLDVLDAGYVGHYPDSALPGAVGNLALAGHRQSHAKPFYGVAELEVGDPIIVQTAQAWYVYRVTESYVVLPTDVDVIAANPADPGAEATERLITLTTCHPLWSTRERWIVHGVLDYWVDREDGRPSDLIEEG